MRWRDLGVLPCRAQARNRRGRNDLDREGRVFNGSASRLICTLPRRRHPWLLARVTRSARPGRPIGPLGGARSGWQSLLFQSLCARRDTAERDVLAGESLLEFLPICYDGDRYDRRQAWNGTRGQLPTAKPWGRVVATRNCFSHMVGVAAWQSWERRRSGKANPPRVTDINRQSANHARERVPASL